MLITALTVSASVSQSTRYPLSFDYRVPLTLPLSKFLGVISTTASIFSIESVVAGPGAVAGVVVALLGGLLIIFAIFLRWPWFRRIVDLVARTTPYWISIGRNIRPSETATRVGATRSDIAMEQLANSNTTVV